MLITLRHNLDYLRWNKSWVLTIFSRTPSHIVLYFLRQIPTRLSYITSDNIGIEFKTLNVEVNIYERFLTDLPVVMDLLLAFVLPGWLLHMRKILKMLYSWFTLVTLVFFLIMFCTICTNNENISSIETVIL